MSDDRLTIRLPMTGAEFAPFLNSTTRINSKDPQIVALAKQIAGEDNDGRSVARKIGEWTYGNLKWKKVESDTVADRERVGYRFSVTNPDGDFLVEQQAFLAPRDGRIGWMRVVCSGYRPVA